MIVCAGRTNRKILITAGAAAQRVSPACDAWSWHTLRSPTRPAAAVATVFPLESLLTAQTAGVIEVIVTVRPELAVAISETFFSKEAFAGCAKVIA